MGEKAIVRAVRQIHVLVDLSNSGAFRGVARLNPPTVADRLDEIVERTATSLFDAFGGPLELRFRLYHGWFDADGRGTDLHNLARPHVSRAFPTLLRAHRIFVELALGPAGIVGQVLSHTYRQDPGLPPASLVIADEPPLACSHQATCGVPRLRTWLRGRCPEAEPACPVRLTEVVTCRRQKLVDTALVADLVWLAAKGYDVAMLSDDEDVVPGLLAASTFPITVSWLCRTGSPRPTYSPVIALQRIRCLEC